MMNANELDEMTFESDSQPAAKSLWSATRRCIGALALLSVASLGSAMWASADLTPPPPGDDGSDPTVGTLPMVGDTEDDFFDQTITLRGPRTSVESAVLSAGGNGAAEVIDLGSGQIWVRYYGDIQLELDLASLDQLTIEIFTGFEGNGMVYAIGQANGFGTARQIGPGGVIGLDPVRLSDVGLLDDPLFVLGIHQSGDRTQTSMELLPNDSAVVFTQDV